VADVSRHYSRGGPYARVTDALAKIAPPDTPLTHDQLGGFDDFHTGGRVATERLAGLLAPGRGEVVLDAGCGLGGPARYLADRFGCRVIGVDLTPEFVALARLLTERTGLSDLVEVRVGDITALDLADGEVDHVMTQHVAMNIADRERLYAEIRRVMRGGGRFALFDVIDGGNGELVLPVPWATETEHSHLVTRDRMRELLVGAGFRIQVWDDPTEEMVGILEALAEAQREGAERPVLTPGLFIDDAPTKLASYLRNMREGRTALALAVCVAA
jgi:sarcosine/dimethylglycine N-methyltransferase